jgi:hypothetical protein
VTAHLTRLTGLWPPFAPSAGTPAAPWYGDDELLLMPGDDPGSAPPYDLLEAVIARLRGSVPLRADAWLGWHSAASSMAGTPVGRVQVVAEAESYTSAGGVFADGMLQVSVFAPDRATARRKADLARAALYDAPLTFEEGTLNLLRPAGQLREVPDPGVGPGGSNLFHVARTFPFRVVS